MLLYTAKYKTACSVLPKTVVSNVRYTIKHMLKLKEYI